VRESEKMIIFSFLVTTRIESEKDKRLRYVVRRGEEEEEEHRTTVTFLVGKVNGLPEVALCFGGCRVPVCLKVVIIMVCPDIG